MKVSSTAVRRGKRRVQGMLLGHITPQEAGADGGRRSSTWTEERLLTRVVGEGSRPGEKGLEAMEEPSTTSSNEKMVTKPILVC